MVDKIQATGGSYAPRFVPRTRATRSDVASTHEVTPSGDRVEISELAHWRAQVGSVPEVRSEKISAVQAELANGTYETSEKWDQAIDKLLDDLASNEI